MPNTTVMQAKRLGVLTCAPDTTLVSAAQRMTGEDVSALVVVDDDGGLAGIISRTDLLRAWEKGGPWAERTVEQYMSRNVVTVGLETTLGEVTDLLLEGRIHRVVVVRQEGDKVRPVGVVSAADVVYHMLKQESRARSAASG
ncbi:MAG: CBS domain-containing protein [Anaerolineae bacterium]|jgi:CBS-domain-containing membrane protein|nr:CBS domain-containing protein [Anaerolineae bacterium]